ncbi:MAG: hypothetical protein SXQ77_09845, partial [Halobacteria archaeon]|nr:hypothetical protein [Halobacteria archaeon]
LREVQSKERQGDSLQELKDDFYTETAEYIRRMREKRDNLDDPFSDEAQRINDAVSTAQEIGEAIYERRVGKVVKLASLSANGVNVDEGGMTREEREMYEDIVGVIERNHQHVVGEMLKGETESSQESAREKDREERSQNTQSEPEEIATEKAVTRDGGETHAQSSESELEPEPEHNGDGQSESGNDYTTVRVKKNLPEFMGVDGEEYELGEEDVAMIPDENADVLCEKDAAVKLDPA